MPRTSRNFSLVLFVEPTTLKQRKKLYLQGESLRARAPHCPRKNIYDHFPKLIRKNALIKTKGRDINHSEIYLIPNNNKSTKVKRAYLEFQDTFLEKIRFDYWEIFPLLVNLLPPTSPAKKNH